MNVYATTTDMGAVPGAEIGDDTATMIEFASDLIRQATRNDLYRTDGNLMPMEPFIIEAFKKATIAQVMAWQFGGIRLADLYAGAATLPVGATRTRIGSGEIDRDPAAIAIQNKARLNLITKLCPRSYTILRAINMCSTAVGLW